MEYDSRPKIKILSFKDPEEKTKDLFFANPKVMWILSAVVGLIIGGFSYLIAENFIIPLVIALAVTFGMGYFISFLDSRKRKYFHPLISSIQQELQEQEITLSETDVRNLLSLKEHRITPKKVLAAVTGKEELSILLLEDPVKVKEKKEKAKEFKVEVLDKAQKPESLSNPSKVAESTENITVDDGSEEPENTEDGENASLKNLSGTVEILSEFVSGDNENPASTNAIDIVTPQQVSKASSEALEPPKTGAIGLIAPGVTGPIPITVGDHSVPYTGLGAHASPGVTPDQDVKKPNADGEAPLRRPRHGRRSAVPNND